MYRAQLGCNDFIFSETEASFDIYFGFPRKHGVVLFLKVRTGRLSMF